MKIEAQSGNWGEEKSINLGEKENILDICGCLLTRQGYRLVGDMKLVEAPSE